MATISQFRSTRLKAYVLLVTATVDRYGLISRLYSTSENRHGWWWIQRLTRRIRHRGVRNQTYEAF